MDTSHSKVHVLGRKPATRKEALLVCGRPPPPLMDGGERVQLYSISSSTGTLWASFEKPCVVISCWG